MRLWFLDFNPNAFLWILLPGFEELMRFQLVKVLLFKNSASITRFLFLSRHLSSPFRLMADLKRGTLGFLTKKIMQWMEYNSCSSFQSNIFLSDWNVSHTEGDVFSFSSATMQHHSSWLVLDLSPTFFLCSGYKISRTFQMPLHSFIGDQRPVSTLASSFRWFQMIAQLLKRSPAHFFT